MATYLTPLHTYQHSNFHPPVLVRGQNRSQFLSLRVADESVTCCCVSVDVVNLFQVDHGGGQLRDVAE